MITGKVIDSKLNETLPGANVYFSDAQGSPGSASNGTATNGDGEFSFSKAYGQYLTASFIGYSKKTITVWDDHDYMIYLDPDGITLPEIEIFGNRVEAEGFWTTKKLLIGAAAVVTALTLLLFIPKR